MRFMEVSFVESRFAAGTASLIFAAGLSDVNWLCRYAATEASDNAC